MRSTLFLAIPLLLICTVLQTAVLPHFPILGYVPSLPFLVVVAWGLLRGTNEGVAWAFIAGVLVDLFSAAPTGGSALTYMVAVLAVTLLNEALPVNRFVLPLVFAALATVIQQVLYFLFLRIFGYGTTLATAVSLLPLVLLNGFLVLPLYWAMYGIQRVLLPKPIEV